MSVINYTYWRLHVSFFVIFYSWSFTSYYQTRIASLMLVVIKFAMFYMMQTLIGFVDKLYSLGILFLWDKWFPSFFNPELKSDRSKIALSTLIGVWTFQAQFNQNPTKLLHLLNINATWLRNWFRSCSLYTTLPLSSFQSLLNRVITFPNWYKKNALACYKSVRK